MIDALARKQNATVHDATYRFYLAQVAHGSLEAKSFAKAQDSAQESYYDLIGALRPWEGSSYLHRKKKEFGGYRQAFIDAFGVDPLDPAFKKWEAEAIAKANLVDGQPLPETPEETIQRRKREQDVQRKQQGR